MAKRQVSFMVHGSVFVIALVLYSSCLFASGQSTGRLITEPLRYKIVNLSSISAKQGKKLLSEAKIGTVSSFPGSDSLLITARATDLTKALAILEFVDVREKFTVKTILPPDGIENVPSNRQIAEVVGSISIGTFSNPPADTRAARAIVDVHNGAIVVVAQQDMLEKIISAVEGRPIVHEVREEKIERKPGEWIPAFLPDESETEEVLGELKQPAVTTQRYAPEPIPDGEEILKLSLPQTITVIDLLGLVGKHLQLDFMYDPQKVKGDVALMINGKFRGPMKVKDLYPLLESVLKFRGFAMSRGPGNLVKIVPEAEVYDIDPALLQVDKGKVEHGDVIVSRVFQLQYIDTSSAEVFLKAMNLATNVNSVAEAGTLIVTDYAYRMPRIEELLDIIDRPGEPKQYRFRQLRYTMAKTLAPRVKTLAEELGTVSITITTPAPAPTRTPTRGRRTPTRPAAPTPTSTKPTVYLDSDERTNRILMIGLEEQLDVVDSLIDSLDVEKQDLRTLKLYKIRHVGAEDVVIKLSELGIVGTARTTTSGRITRRTPRAATPPAGSAPAARTSTTNATEGPLVDEPQIVVIELTNSLLVNATDEQHAQIRRILAYVDSKTEEEEIPYKVYPLENQKPEDLAAVLNQLIEKTIEDKEGKIQQVVRKTEEEITIIPDENTFSLIVYASKKNQEWIKSLIDQLDKRRPQVLIDVTLVAISEADAFDYDLQLVRKFPRFEKGGQMDYLSALLGSSGTSSTFLTRVAEATSILGDASPAKGFYADSHIQALLSLMQKKGYGRILARPKILVNDNEQGHIDTTSTIYVSRSSQTATPTGETVVQTSYSFDQFPSGITLDITPHISEGDLLRLEITMSRSSQTAPEGGIEENQPPPAKSESNIQTIVTVPDKSTIILGGITTLEQTKNNWKVPIVGDVPLVGGLFRKIDNSSRQTKLYVFVKADILRPDEKLEGLPDLERISEKNRIAFEAFEDRFQKYEDWPGIKPKPMNPLRVLEED